MSNNSVSCFSTSRAQATRIVEQLKTEFFSHNDICVVFADKRKTHDFARAMNTKARGDVFAGAGTGGGIGGALERIAGTDAFATPGVGSLIAAVTIVKESKIIITVHTENSSEILRVEDIFSRSGALDIRTVGEAERI